MEEERKSIWYRPVTKNDYDKIAEIGEVVIKLRFLPGFKERQMYECVCEKDVSRSPFPNQQKWIAPVLVMEDTLHPENNGFVGAYEFAKTVHKCVKNKNTPDDYYALNGGNNFYLRVSLKKSRDGTQYFPDYSKSGFDDAKSNINPKYVYDRLAENQIADFASFVDRLNNPKQKQDYTGNNSFEENTVNNAAFDEPSTYTPNEVKPNQAASKTAQSSPWGDDEAAPEAPSVPSTSNDDFDAIFG